VTALFERYPATAASIRGSVGDLTASGTAIQSLTYGVALAHERATSSVIGSLLAPLTAALDPVTARGRQLGEAAGFCAGALTMFAGAVEAYDRRIDELNAEYAAAAGSGFGVSEPQQRAGMSTEAVQASLDRYDTAVANARAALIARLTRERAHAEQVLDGVADGVAGMLGRGPNDEDWQTMSAAGALPAMPLPSVPGAGPGEPGGPQFVIGPPTTPSFTWDNDFPYDPDASASIGDHLSWIKWMAKLRGGQALRSDLDDATQAYRHYMDGSGDPLWIDYEEAYNEDEAIRRAVDNEIISAQQWAERLARRSGQTSFSMTGDPSLASALAGAYPSSENWQKTLGDHQIWSSADVRVDGNRVTMTVTVNAADHYNFNRDENDIATGASDNENGRFAELGWAKGFDTNGQVTREISWLLGEAGEGEVLDSGDPGRNPGREDREDERDSGDPDRPTRPDNDRDTGAPRGS